MNQPKVIILLLNWNCIEDTRKCLQSLLKIDYVNYEIIVVDNGSKVDEGTILKNEFSDIKLIKSSKNLGFAGGNNVGIKHALKNGAEYILLLNTDTTVKPDFLTEMVATGESNQSYGVIGSKVYFMEKPEKLMHFGLFIDVPTSMIVSDGYDTDGSQFQEVKEYDYVGGCCLLIKTEVIEKVGLLDERFFAYFEETDWCFRAKEAGFKVVGCPNAIIWHKVPYPPVDKRGAFQNYLVTRNRLLFTRKHLKSGFVKYLFLNIKNYLIIPVLKSIKHKEWKNIRAYILGWLDYFLGNWGMNRKM